LIKNEVFVQSPTRIDFSGGTLDCWPINALLNPVTTINVAISIYTTCRLSRRDDEKIMIHSRETQASFEFDNMNQLLKSDDPNLLFFKEHIQFWQPQCGFNLSVQSDSPVGGGLGGSSSLSISIFKAFSQLLDISYDAHKTVAICAGIEAKILKMPTGTQDYYPALKGGFNIIDYNYGQPSLENLPVNDLDINNHISIFFTGRSHFSGINNWQVMKNFIDGDPTTALALEKIRQVSESMKQVIRERQWSQLPKLFQAEFDARMQLAESFSSPEIEQLAQIATDNGADAIKICGAGGGGCVFVWSDPSVRSQVISACTEAGFQHLDVELV
jgi:D-glycero-alpha-D-manno-heptose-7-phosphate kinase